MNTRKTNLYDKIKNLGSAIFFNLSDAVLKLQTSIVKIIHVDEFGYLWFFVQKPPQHINEFEKEFPVRLDFFRKGMDYSLQVLGKGSIVNDPEEILLVTSQIEETRTYDPDRMILIKVKINRVDCFENITSQKSSWFQNAISTLQSWLFPHTPSYGPVTYYPGISEAS
ncbi:MAG: hypothetical protein C4308_00185 [Chitinophagaceae bacterium]